jgi:hypothetical protein
MGQLLGCADGDEAVSTVTGCAGYGLTVTGCVDGYADGYGLC